MLAPNRPSAMIHRIVTRRDLNLHFDAAGWGIMNVNLDEPVVLEEVNAALEMLPLEALLPPPRKRSDLQRLDLLMWALWFLLGIAAGTAGLRL